jgi:hypothetical protein
MHDNENHRIDHICDEQQKAYLRRSSIHFLECAVHLCVTHMTVEETALLLEQQAILLRDHG